MSLPFSSIVPISAKVVSPAFTTEKKHLLLAMVNQTITTEEPYLVFSGSSAVNDFKKYFGNIPEVQDVQKYFGFLSKRGLSPEKLVVGSWYRTSTAPFYKGNKVTAPVSALGDGSFTVTFDNFSQEVTLNLSALTSYSQVAEAIQVAIRSGDEPSLADVVCTYNSTTGGFIITGGSAGKDHKILPVVDGLNELGSKLGLVDCKLSQGVDQESYRDFCDRMMHANGGGFAITTNIELTPDEIKDAVDWLQGSFGEQTIYSLYKLIFNIKDKDEAKTLQQELISLGYTGYVVTYDPYNEHPHILDSAIGASVDFNLNNGSINFNFQPAVGYTPVTNLGTVVDYQQGLTNSSLMNELDSNCISCVYSVGFGSQQSVYYGSGLMANAFGTEDVQINESGLEGDIQVAVMNVFTALDKLKLQGTDADEAISNIIDPVMKKFQRNGAIAYNGVLSNTDKVIVSQTLGADIIDTLQSNGYYFRVEERTAEDISLRRVRILIAYISGGVINKVRITNNIYGA